MRTGYMKLVLPSRAAQSLQYQAPFGVSFNPTQPKWNCASRARASNETRMGRTVDGEGDGSSACATRRREGNDGSSGLYQQRTATSVTHPFALATIGIVTRDHLPVRGELAVAIVGLAWSWYEVARQRGVASGWRTGRFAFPLAFLLPKDPVLFPLWAFPRVAAGRGRGRGGGRSSVG